MLRHSSDDEPGYSRQKKGRSWAYFDERGKRITDRAEIDRLNAIALPPAYTDAWFCKDANGHLQATGRDDRGRKQYRYHADFRSKREASKFEGCLEFGQALPRLRARVERDLKKGKLERDTVLAAVIRLLDREHIRVGNEEYARANRSFGLTTLRSRHVKRAGGKLKMRFPGKSGIVHEATITDRNLLRVVKKCQDLPGQMLFQYVNGDGKPQAISSSDVNDYIRDATGGDFTAKHFRTWGGERHLLQGNAGQGRRKTPQPQDCARTRCGSTRQHAGNQPQELCSPTTDRNAAGGSARSTSRLHAAASAPPPVQRRNRVPGIPQEEKAAPPAQGPGLNLPASPATSTAMIKLNAPVAPREIGSVLDWTLANLDRLAIGALIAAAIVGVMLVMRWIGHRILAGEPEMWGWKGIIGRVLAKTSIAFMVAAAIDIVVSYAAIPTKLAHLADIFFLIAASLQVAIWAREILVGVIRSRVGEDPGASTLGNAMALIRVLVNVVVFAIALVVILGNLGVNVTGLIAGLGIGGIAIGLAAQGIFSDLFAALSIVFDKPFRRGDTIRYGSGTDTTTGTVERIGLKTTRVRSQTGEQVIMANTKLLEQEVRNLAEAKVRRITLPFSLTYQTSADTLERLPQVAEEAVKLVKTAKLVRCVATAFAPSSIDCELVYDDRTISPDTLAHHKSDIIIAVARAFAREKIEFAYPTQTTYTAAPDGTLVMPWATPPSTK